MTVSLMVLVALITMGLLSLSAISLRSTGRNSARQEARANARLALLAALARLQESAGDDRRITAGASILGEVEQAHAVGVWESWSPELANNPTHRGPDYEEEKDQRFLRWLVSGPEPDLTSREWAATAPTGETRELFGDRSDGFSLRAPLVLVDNGNSGGGYAWAIAQENTKAKLSVSGPGDGDYAANDAFEAQPRPSLALSEFFEGPEGAWNQRAGRLVSYGQSRLDEDLHATEDSAQGRAHFTASSLGVLANVVDGGLKVDLSLGMETDDADFNASTWSDSKESFRNPFHADSETDYSIQRSYLGQRPLYQPIARSAVHETKRSFWPANVHHYIPSNGVPTFHTLRSFCRLPHHLYRTPDGLTVFERAIDHVAGAPGRVDHGYFEPPPATVDARQTQIGIRPVMDRVMFLVSGALSRNDELAWAITPVVTLWNPYDVALEIEGAVAHIWVDIPFGFTWEVFDNRGNQVFNRHLHTSGIVCHQFIHHNHGRQVDPYFYAAMTATGQPLGSTGSVPPIRFEPGEVRVFAPARQRLQAFRAGAPIRDRTVFLRPVDSLAQFTTEGGLLIPTRNEISGFGYTYRLSRRDKAQISFYPVQGEDYPFYISVEDATRAKGDNPTHQTRGKPIADVLANNFARSGELARFQSPRLSYSTLKREPVPIGVLETYHRVARQGADAQVADLVYTGNPRQPWMNPFITQASFQTGPQYQMRMRPVSSFNGVLQTTSGGRSAFYGASQTPVGGRTHLSFFEVPRAPLLSLAALQHADLASTPFSPANQFANSWANAYVRRDRVGEQTRPRQILGLAQSDRVIELDHCYLANEALWDGWFFSSAAPTLDHANGTGRPGVWERPVAGESRSLAEVLADFVEDPNEHPLRNSRMRLHRRGMDSDALVSSLLAPEGCLKIAGHLMVDGAFNVNSTSTEAWEAVLAGLRGATFETGKSKAGGGDETPFPRFRYPVGDPNDHWHGFRTLSDEQIESLAEEIVIEIKKRGPFLSLAEFVNRRVEQGELGLSGALQSAIDRAGINDRARQDQFSTENYEASSRSNIMPNDTGVGTPGYLTQADVLKSLAPVITVRSDTFTIRTYGEARSADGRIQARAWTEATVQRYPEFIDPSDASYTPSDQLNDINAKFGRRFRVVSFRYLNNVEARS